MRITFGAIAAANALSDVYAMGGKPISALSILAWPAKGDLDELSEILRGGAEKIARGRIARCWAGTASRTTRSSSGMRSLA